jgi:hypothetical protein
MVRIEYGVFFIWNQLQRKNGVAMPNWKLSADKSRKKIPAIWDELADRVLAEANAEKLIGRKSLQP